MLWRDERGEQAGGRLRALKSPKRLTGLGERSIRKARVGGELNGMNLRVFLVRSSRVRKN